MAILTSRGTPHSIDSAATAPRGVSGPVGAPPGALGGPAQVRHALDACQEVTAFVFHDDLLASGTPHRFMGSQHLKEVLHSMSGGIILSFYKLFASQVCWIMKTL